VAVQVGECDALWRKTRVGVFGGSFDPIHVGHIAAAEDAAQALGLDKVILVPVGTPPHKERGPFASGEDRLAMAREAVRDRLRLEVSDIEVRRPGKSYTIDTIRELADRLGPGCELWLLVGTDAAREIDSWREAEALLSLARPAVLERPGEPPLDWRSFEGRLPAEAVARLRGGVVRLPHGMRLSSTEVRARLASGGSARGLLPPAVERYIRERGLYGVSTRPPEGG